MTDISSASTFALSSVAILVAYLLGAIPFGYIITRAASGIDIRTVGSGNIGATNVGRVLGRRYFFLVLALDLFKGLIPTLGFPWLFRRSFGPVPVDLPVLIGLAAILGHTFPVYLRFRGGKGVATSLGVILALDPASCGVAAIVFGAVLLTTRYMSLASIVGGVGFAASHLFRQDEPLNREHIAMSLFSIAVVALLLIRHRSNFARIRAGTENRVDLGRSRPSDRNPPTPPSSPTDPPRGRIVPILALVLVVLSIAVVAAVWLVRNANHPVAMAAGPWALRETDRYATGQQRVDRVAFAAGGDRLAGIGPRYNHLLIYEVDTSLRLRPIAETPLEGRPVSIVALGSRFIILQRPSGDQKHMEPGWWELFDRDGKKVGSRQPTGYYPDDLVLAPDGRFLYILCSGRSEGDQKKPLPALDVVAIDEAGGSARSVGRLTLDPSDDPSRLTLSASGRFASVFLAKSKQTEAIDLTIPDSPVLIDRTRPVTAQAPYVSLSPDADWIMMPTATDDDAIAISLPGASISSSHPDEGVRHPRADYLILSHQSESALEIQQVTPKVSLGRFPLLGPYHLGRTRPTGLAYSPERGLIAVATRTGSIHLVELHSRIGDLPTRGAMIATTPSDHHRK